MTINIASLHLWGDSVAKGVVFNEARGRYCITPARCVPALEQALGMPIVNHARMGAIAEEGLADFEATDVEPGALVVIEYGGNDCDMPWKAVSQAPQGEYNGRVSRESFAGTLARFVTLARARGLYPLLVTPPPLEAGRYFEWVSRGLSKDAILSFLGDVQHIYRWQERYANAVRQVATQARCALFDLRDAFLDSRRLPELICVDGIHPNDRGHALIVEAVLRAREDLRRQLAAMR